MMTDRPIVTAFNKAKSTKDSKIFNKDVKEFITAICLQQPIWPNSWCQDVSMAAFSLKERDIVYQQRIQYLEEQIFELEHYISAIS